jgi:uroporphyrinogen decarboxylase
MDWTMDLGKARKEIGDRVALQGNMDPTVLYGNKEKITEEVKRILSNYGDGTGHIFNLGHGILPDVKPENAKFFIETVKEESKVFHR